jgi:hypothetical protein
MNDQGIAPSTGRCGLSRPALRKTDSSKKQTKAQSAARRHARAKCRKPATSISLARKQIKATGFPKVFQVSNIISLLADSKLHDRITVGFIFVSALSYDLGLLAALGWLR